MLAWLRTTKGLGGTGVYLRLRGASVNIGKFWDWAGLTWVTPQTANCKLFLGEYADSSLTESFYAVEFTPPADSYIQEGVIDSTGEVESVGTEMDIIINRLTAGVTVNQMQVGIGVLKDIAIRTNNAVIRVKRGDVKYQGFNLGPSFYKPGARYFFCAKEVQNAPNTDAIVNREMAVSDILNVAVNITFTALETAIVKTHFAEIERRDADGTSNPLTCWEGKLEIS